MKSIAKLLIITLVVISFACCKWSENSEESYKISGEGWKIWLDSLAKWNHDPIYLPGEFVLEELKENPPTIGWEKLFEMAGTNCSLPASAEEYFGTSNEWTYHGVMWFFKEVYIPEDFANLLNFIKINSFRHRLEIYINEKLAGYDIIALTPYSSEVSEFLNPGQVNRIAFRVTNPGGQRGWEDYQLENWNGKHLPASYNYGGIGGDVYLRATDSIFISDVFVKNLLPTEKNKIELNYSINNSTNSNAKVGLSIRIINKNSGKVILKEKLTNTISPGINTLQKVMEVAGALKWDTENPNIYQCQVSLNGPGKITDKYSQDFGFRVFELRETETGKNFYLNNKRLRIRSAIDWGQYAYNGLYPTKEMALKSVRAVKEVGHNTISFHRRIGEPLLMNIADSLGVLMYEEPGGLHFNNEPDSSFLVKFMEEKIRRMVIRDRNHPGLIIYSLANEDYGWTPWRKRYLEMINQMDNSRLIVNSSGYEPKPNYHIKPYNLKIETDFIDEHTVGSSSRFDENIFHSHKPHGDSVFNYYGEVACYTGPPSVIELVNESVRTKGFDLNLYQPLYQKIMDLFYSCNIKNYGSMHISSPEDITRQVSRGLMYTNGRLGQVVMSHDLNDGYAINGWSDGPQTYDAWSSAILDMGRNLKGPGSDMKFWNKPLQVAIFRQNGKYFNPGDTALFRICIINEGFIEAGNYQLKLQVKDGIGEIFEVKTSLPVLIEGGDVYAQEIAGNFPLILNEEWHAGHITLEGFLMSGIDTIASGKEQVLLKNRPSWNGALKSKKIAVISWDEAAKALAAAGISIASIDDPEIDCILAGEPTDSLLLADIITKLYSRQIKLIIRFNEEWADFLYKKRLLSEKVIAWGGYQSHDWNGNGWGYIDHFIGNQAVPSENIVSTRSWEVPGDPVGFYPFKSFHEQEVYGIYLARELYPEPKWGDLKGKGEFLRQTYSKNNQLLVILGGLKVGMGKVILAPSYPVDANNAFSDLLFFNLIN